MNQRHTHCLKGNKGTEAASSWIFFDTETLPTPAPDSPTRTIHKWRLAVAYACRLEKGKRRCEEWIECQTIDQFWSFVKSRLSEHRPTWLVAHNLGFDFPVADGFNLLLRHGIEQWKLVFGDGPTIMSGHIDGKKIVIVDTLNYCKRSIASLGESLGLSKMPMPAFEAPDADWYAYCKRDVEICAATMLGIVQLHRERDLGVVGKTLAACAMHAFRHRHLHHPIVIHENDAVLSWERQAYYGGCVECAKIGQVQGPLYQLDVNSLYAYIMRDTPLPWKLADVVEDVPVDWLYEQCGLRDAVAHVLIESDTHTYPLRRVKLMPANLAVQERDEFWRRKIEYERPIYPTGTYITWLAGEELRQALVRGHVQKCARAALYERAVLFRSYVDEWYSFRLACKAKGDSFGERLAKGYLQVLSGVWAKKAPRYASADDWWPPQPWARWSCKDEIAGSIRYFRAIANVPQELVEEGESYDSFPAISACINAAARERMRDLQAICGQGHWFYTDTDSLVVDQAGLDALKLAGSVSDAQLGALRLQSSADGATIVGVKDYIFGSRIVLKGIHGKATQIGKNTYEQDEWGGFSAAVRNRGAAEQQVNRKTITLKREYTKGEVGEDGWTTPYHICEEGALDWLF